EEARADWVQLESPHSVDEIRAARAAVEGPFSFMKGKLGRYLGLDEHLALGVAIAWYPSFTHQVTWAALWDFMTAFQERGLAAWEPYRATGRSGRVTYSKGERHYRRKLGMATREETPGGYMAGFTGVARERQPSPLVDADPAARIADMDYEGVEVNLTLPSGWFGTWTAGDDVALEMAMYRAYHRWLADYCGAYPRRLGGVILAGSRDVAGSLAEIRHWRGAGWAWGLMVYAPAGMPLDHPDIEPLYAAAAELDLAVV